MKWGCIRSVRSLPFPGRKWRGWVGRRWSPLFVYAMEALSHFSSGICNNVVEDMNHVFCALPEHMARYIFRAYHILWLIFLRAPFVVEGAFHSGCSDYCVKLSKEDAQEVLEVFVNVALEGSGSVVRDGFFFYPASLLIC